MSINALTVGNGGNSLSVALDRSFLPILVTTLGLTLRSIISEKVWTQSTKPLKHLFLKHFTITACTFVPAIIVKSAFYLVAHRFDNEPNAPRRMYIKNERIIERMIYTVSVLAISVIVIPQLYSKLKGKVYVINTPGIVKSFIVQSIYQITISETFACYRNKINESIESKPRPWIEYYLGRKTLEEIFADSEEATAQFSLAGFITSALTLLPLEPSLERALFEKNHP